MEFFFLTVSRDFNSFPQFLSLSPVGIQNITLMSVKSPHNHFHENACFPFFVCIRLSEVIMTYKQKRCGTSCHKEHTVHFHSSLRYTHKGPRYHGVFQASFLKSGLEFWYDFYLHS